MEAPVINYLAIFLGACLSFILGVVWYSPFLFGNVWLNGLKINKKVTKEELGEKRAATIYTAVFMGWLLLSLGIEWLSGYLKVVTWDNGLIMGLWLSACFVYPFGVHYFVLENKPFKHFAVNSGFLVLCVVVLSVLLALW